ncbi:hypothetical protein CK489_33080 [Bradyrhizobium sp. UFLA03-84]|nr:hypothetical protein [Bradyrhizobium sp. UFLA03-84]PAY04111.1 hypothetical protein CK489_33080 [Bradyrhizobium sp. UFLA03-84]
MHWHHIENAPFDRELELAVIDSDGVHSLIFPCRRVLGGWIISTSGAALKIRPTHWREWSTSVLPYAKTYH